MKWKKNELLSQYNEANHSQHKDAEAEEVWIIGGSPRRASNIAMNLDGGLD